MTDARIHSDAVGTIVFDADLAPQVGHPWFDPDAWQRASRLRARGGGRASACFIDTPIGPCVLRHFHRGGMVASLLGDRYLWNGRERTRSFAEFRLLARMHALGLPVPEPVAARYRRYGMYYTADLLTRQIEGADTLATCLAEGRLDAALAERTGRLIARFHRHGVWHADLNAHNVLATPEALYLIDFDRGDMRRPAVGWQHANLQRLRRSLIKLGAARDGEEAFERDVWNPLMHGYASGMEQETAK
ncbi:3-deoxy-D-manno-octulosonic acid kinase [Oleiagrimonas soli]|uniref:3-deoxy-D-manno-octulosonic acid kinase n=1 Tax=Oleiagrimonas soli TaxID=1543381 RepID=A0A099CUZ4_9GAMM|nr:3-deoxy-D-manno-octulosonic acid kinase [Oleiagrimonas soli]KGI77589.1 3-deoxy-D-manno-octulosonic acid kinase [Oleiagrimonas soli]MBB6182922.1 3-deoxy-D-manno-octulosonic acid kinase [Oleiagrimonas soli]